MKTYEIWIEGYECTGQSSGALFKGIYEGNSLKEACLNKAIKDPDFAKYLKCAPGKNGRCSYWGCTIFDNEKDARKLFG